MRCLSTVLMTVPQLPDFLSKGFCGRGFPMFCSALHDNASSWLHAHGLRHKLYIHNLSLAAHEFDSNAILTANLVSCFGKLLRRHGSTLSSGAVVDCAPHSSGPWPQLVKGTDERCRSKWLFAICLCFGFAMNSGLNGSFVGDLPRLARHQRAVAKADPGNVGGSRTSPSPRTGLVTCCG